MPTKNTVSENILLINKDSIRYPIIRSNVLEISDDTYHRCFDKGEPAKIYVSKDDYWTIKRKIPGWKYMKKFIIKSHSASLRKKDKSYN